MLISVSFSPIILNVLGNEICKSCLKNILIFFSTSFLKFILHSLIKQKDLGQIISGSQETPLWGNERCVAEMVLGLTTQRTNYSS